MRLHIHESEARTENGDVLLMNAGPYTGVFAPMPVSDEDRMGMRDAVHKLANHYMGMADDSALENGEELALSEIKAAIAAHFIEGGE